MFFTALPGSRLGFCDQHPKKCSISTFSARSSRLARDLARTRQWPPSPCPQSGSGRGVLSGRPNPGMCHSPVDSFREPPADRQGWWRNGHTDGSAGRRLGRRVFGLEWPTWTAALQMLAMYSLKFHYAYMVTPRYLCDSLLALSPTFNAFVAALSFPAFINEVVNRDHLL